MDRTRNETTLARLTPFRQSHDIARSARPYIHRVKTQPLSAVIAMTADCNSRLYQLPPRELADSDNRTA
jgi:hypothetical protein